MSERLDDEKLETLRRWGTGIAADGRDELRAAGKAILILVEEIERLQVDVWHARHAANDARSDEHGSARPSSEPLAKPSPEEVAEEFLGANQPSEAFESALRRRLRRILPDRPVGRT